MAKTAEEIQAAEDVRSTLAKFASSNYAPDLGVAYHLTPEHKVSLPNGMDLGKGAKILAEADKASRETQVFTKIFKYRPNDGAAALVRVMQKYFGTTGRGKPIQTFFGSIPPQQKEIEIGYGETIQVPWGHIAFEHLEGTLMLGYDYDAEYGQLFELAIECPKKYDASVHGFFNLIEEELKTGSIYKGKAIRGTDEPRFMDLQVDDAIVYNSEVYDALETSVWGVIRETVMLREMKIKTDPKVLLHGPYGTGKSEAGRMTAKVAVDNGWTFIAFNSGKSQISELEHTLKTARLLAPAVVFVEDVDLYAENKDEATQSRMLEMFDGLSSKGHEVMVLMTSNKPGNFNKGMLRAGRINRMIEIGPLNREATEELIRRSTGEQLGEVDFDKVWEAMAGFEPAFVRQTFNDARQAAAIRHASELRLSGQWSHQASQDFKLQTDDFVTAANLMRPQHEAHSAATDTLKEPNIDELLGQKIVEVLTDRLYFEDARANQIDVYPVVDGDVVR